MFPTISLDFAVNYYKLMFVFLSADCKLRQQMSKTSRELTFPVDLRHFRIIWNDKNLEVPSLTYDFVRYGCRQ